MLPEFNSAELNQLLQLELSEGRYVTPEDALVAGLRVLRENRESRVRFADRLASLGDGRAIELDGDDALTEFLDAIDSEVDAELRGSQQPNS